MFRKQLLPRRKRSRLCRGLSRMSFATKKLVVLAGLVVLLLLFSRGLRAGDEVLIPDGFAGWVEIRYKEPGTPPVRRSGLKPLLTIPSSGRMLTSSSRSTGYGDDHYYFLSPEGRRTEIRNDTGGCGENELCVQQFEYYSSPQVTVFFVGRAHDLPSYKRPTIE
jgi:hypothetical protein